MTLREMYERAHRVPGPPSDWARGYFVTVDHRLPLYFALEDAARSFLAAEDAWMEDGDPNTSPPSTHALYIALAALDNAERSTEQ